MPCLANIASLTSEPESHLVEPFHTRDGSLSRRMHSRSKRIRHHRRTRTAAEVGGPFAAAVLRGIVQGGIPVGRACAAG